MSHDFSRITDAIVDDMLALHTRPLDCVYPVVLVDGIRIKIRDGPVTNRTVYVAMGVNMDGDRDILGLWAGPTGGESPKFWLGVFTDLRNRGIADVLVLCCDGLKGMPDSAMWMISKRSVENGQHASTPGISCSMTQPATPGQTRCYSRTCSCSERTGPN